MSRRRVIFLCVITAGCLGGVLGGCDGLSFRSPPPPPSLAERQQAITTTPTSTVVPDQPSPEVDPPASPTTAIRPYTEWTLPELAADSLGKIGPEAVPRLSDLLQDRDPEVRQVAARILARIGPDAAAAVPDLIELLQDPHPQVRRAAVRALGQIGPQAGAAVPALLQLLDTDSAATPTRDRMP